jgi:endonuclease/exonuclease/phosphatase family metal-dependent hydrolase
LQERDLFQDGDMLRPLALVSFNILEGLRPLGEQAGERRLLDRQRRQAAIALVRGLNPDILVLNEALFCRAHAGRAVDYANLFGFQHQAAALYDGAWGNVILSQHPITRSGELRIYNRGGLTAVISTPLGVLTVASYHPHPLRSPENKARDFASMVATLEGPLLVCGDFNAISPEDAIDRAQLIAAFAGFSGEPEQAVDRFMESGALVFAELAKFGLRDAIPVQGRRYSIPTDLINPDKRSAMRIDHILANASIEVVAGEVMHSLESNRASDHHPVMLTFRLRSG